VSAPLSVTFYTADQNPHRDRSLGITGYTKGLLSSLQKCRPEIVLKTFSSKNGAIFPSNSSCRLCWRTDRTLPRIFTDHLHSPFLQRADIYHYPKGFLPILQVNRPVIITLHDTILQHYADYYPNERNRMAYLYWINLMKWSVERATAVFTVSQSVSMSLASFCERHNIHQPRTICTYEGAHGEEEAGKLWPKRDYVMAFCSSHPHKRTSTLLQFWKELQAENLVPPLILIGSISHSDQAVLSKLKNITHMPFVPSDTLKDLLRSARALILPSEIEGFGLPALEAVYASTPVVFVKGTAVEEILGHPDSCGFSLTDLQSFYIALSEAMRVPIEDIASLALRLRKIYSWQRVAERTLAAYREVLSLPSARFYV